MPLHMLLDLSKNIYFSKSYSRKLFVVKKTQLDFQKNIFKKLFKKSKILIFEKIIFSSCFFWIPLVLGFFQWISHSTPDNSVLRELLSPGGCLGTPSASPAPPAPAGCSPSLWLPRNSQFRDLPKPCNPVSGRGYYASSDRWCHFRQRVSMTSCNSIIPNDVINLQFTRV